MQIFLQNNIWFFILIALWVLPWKAYALWTSARASHKIWFILLVVLNTLAILEIIYIFFIAKKKPKDLLKSLKTNI